LEAGSRPLEADPALPPAVAPHVVLVGLPGAGKTSVGRALATRLGRPFVDFDQEIERREGQPVARIFAERGEAHFRTLERRLTEEMRDAGGGMVLAPGGGWVTVPGVVELLRPPAAVIYLAAEPGTALRRMGPRRDLRPLLAASDPLAALNRLLEERGGLYEGASDLVVDTERIDVQGLTEQLAEWISLFGGTSVMPPG
jgi:shikimate kinase